MVQVRPCTAAVGNTAQASSPLPPGTRISLPASPAGAIWMRTEAMDDGFSDKISYFDMTPRQPRSPWHDVPLEAGPGLYNFVCEIPRMTRAKMEVDTKAAHNPIVQDVTKKGEPRYYHGPIFWNYGCLPMTWEDPGIKGTAEVMECKGDNDPLDVVEIGSVARASGSVTPVKPLGVLAMIDDGELDWKVIAIAADDPMAAKLDDVTDLDEQLPGTTSGIREWFRWYKTPDAKPINKFGYDEKVLNKAECLKVIAETHARYVALVAGRTDTVGLWTG